MNSHELLSEVISILAENYTPAKLIIEGKIEATFEGDLIKYEDESLGLNNIKEETRDNFVNFDHGSIKSIHIEDTFGSISEVTITIEV